MPSEEITTAQDIWRDCTSEGELRERNDNLRKGLIKRDAFIAQLDEMIKRLIRERGEARAALAKQAPVIDAARKWQTEFLARETAPAMVELKLHEAVGALDGGEDGK